MIAQIMLYIAVALLLAWLLYVATRPNPGAVLQLVYLVRFPIIFAALLAIFPVVAVTQLPSMLGNLFILNTAVGIALVMWMAILAAWMAFYTFALLLRAIRHDYPHLPDLLHQLNVRWRDAWIGKYRIWLAALLALPTAAVIALNAEDLGWFMRAVGVSAGLAFAWVFYRLLLWVRPHAIALLQSYPLTALRPFQILPETVRDSLRDGDERDFRHDTALAFLLVSGGIYLAGAWAFSPSRSWDAVLDLPPVFYLYLLLLTLGLFLPALGNQLDRYRVPTSLVLLILSLSVTAVFDTGHYYTVLPRADVRAPTPEGDADAAPEEPVDPETALQSRRRYQSAERPSTSASEQLPYVIVMASGGGVTAATWTAQVLTGLQAQLGDEFANGIALVSAASGGSVGAMFYLDGYTPAGPPQNGPDTVRAAGMSSLRPVAWGMAYPDLWRYFFWFPGLRWDRLTDRGWAMEVAWDNRLRQLAEASGNIPGSGPDDARMFTEWQVSVAEGWRPTAIFNATEVETGARFLFSSAQVETSTTTRTFHATFPNHDVPVATAARMSAAFPYVSPVSRANLTNQEVTESATARGDAIPQNPHLADGGYFDNDGVVSALEWLDVTLRGRTDPPRRIVLIQILASERYTPQERCGAASTGGPGGPLLSQESANRKWLYGLAGPVITLMNVRGASQLQRGQAEIAAFIDLQSRRYPQTEFLYCVFDLREETTLSWQLSREAFERITVTNWDADRTQKRVTAIGRFLELPGD